MTSSNATRGQIPDRIGRYEIRRRLGKGGMGTVYLAHDPRLHRLVAIKLLNDNFRDDEELLQRFMREARSAGGLRHSHIVVVFDVDEDHGRPFIAMEYVEGETLDCVIRAVPPLPLPARIALMEDLCAALAHAHAAGVVHRDIKPANVMLDRSGVLKILDFGIARVANSGLTREGVIMGSVHYISPEQVIGPRIDHRSDIFAAGAVFYELIAHERAFQAESDTGVLRAILYEGAIPLERRIPDVDPELAEIVARALEREPSRRYQDATAMRQDLARVRERLTQPAPVIAPTTIRPAPPAVKSSRTRHWTAGVASLMIAATVSSVLAWAGLRRTPADVPELPRVTLSSNAPPAVPDALDHIRAVQPAPDLPPPARIKPPTTAPPVARMPADQVVSVRNRAHEAIGLGREREALALLQQALRLRPGDPDSLHLLDSMIVEAARMANDARSEAQLQGAPQRARLMFEEADSLLRSADVERRTNRPERAAPLIWNARDRFRAAAASSVRAPDPTPSTPHVPTVVAPSAGDPPPPLPRREPLPPTVDERAALTQTIRDYENAWNARDITALQRVQRLSGAALERVRRNMDDAHTLEVRVRVHAAQIDEKNGTARLLASIDRRFVPRRGREVNHQRSASVVLEKRASGWVIVEIKE